LPFPTASICASGGAAPAASATYASGRAASLSILIAFYFAFHLFLTHIALKLLVLITLQDSSKISFWRVLLCLSGYLLLTFLWTLEISIALHKFHLGQ